MFPQYSRAERVADAVVHLTGVAFGLVGSVTLVAMVLPHADPLRMISLGLYAAGLVAMLGCSALYNLTTNEGRKATYRRLDHAVIFVMIAGTYTPFLLLVIGGTWGVGLLVFVWVVALGGVALKLLFPRRYERLSIAAYLLLGWSILMVLDPLFAAVSPASILLLATGGLLYSLGVVFHLWARLPYQNAIWHACVLAAAICHYAAILRDVVAIA